MEFDAMSPEQYRALNAEEFEARRTSVAEMCMSPDCDVDVEVLRAEAAVIAAEAARRNTAVQLRNLTVSSIANGAGTVMERSGNLVEEAEDPTDRLAYRRAFQELITKGTPIPMELRGDANTLTSDVTSVIPTMLVNRIIETMDECGMILPLVTRMSFKGGVVIPTSTMKPTASWVEEGAGSDRQKKTTSSISFSYHKLRCEISMSMEVGTMALSAFESKFVENVANAMVIAIEKAILAGPANGADRPRGIVNETPATTLTWANEVPTYAELMAVEAAIPAQYEGSTRWCMTKAQFYKILSMVDSVGQPIARVDHGINGQVERTILGRSVVIHPYSEEMGTNKAFLYSFGDYVLNTIYDMGIQRKQDWETEDLLTKAVMSVDGRSIDNGSLILVKAGA